MWVATAGNAKCTPSFVAVQIPELPQLFKGISIPSGSAAIIPPARVVPCPRQPRNQGSTDQLGRRTRTAADIDIAERIHPKNGRGFN